MFTNSKRRYEKAEYWGIVIALMSMTITFIFVSIFAYFVTSSLPNEFSNQQFIKVDGVTGTTVGEMYNLILILVIGLTMFFGVMNFGIISDEQKHYRRKDYNIK